MESTESVTKPVPGVIYLPSIPPYMDVRYLNDFLYYIFVGKSASPHTKSIREDRTSISYTRGYNEVR
jgi:hypothetical protein